ncbi:MAG TPA: Uma2 family endonuclease [Tepidiformaceae bacterium]|nr:Uma2 family endonuclease [Tepidiformaceae bacterium]
MPVSEQTYERLALEDHEGQWEYVCGRVRQKPGMTQEHNSVQWWLAVTLQNQLDRREFEVRSNAGRTHRPSASYFIPDVIVIPVSYFSETKGTGLLESYARPLPFVAEVWSPSTGEYDVDEKFPEYKRRGDLEIWRIHPYERSVTAWRRQVDGSYNETVYTSGEVPVLSLPGVRIKLADLFVSL